MTAPTCPACGAAGSRGGPYGDDWACFADGCRVKTFHRIKDERCECCQRPAGDCSNLRNLDGDAR